MSIKSDNGKSSRREEIRKGSEVEKGREIEEVVVVVMEEGEEEWMTFGNGGE